MEKNRTIKEYRENNHLNLEKIMQEYTYYLSKIIENSSKGFLQKEDIEEILVDTFLALWRNEQKLEEERYLTPYLVGIVKNILKKRYREKNTGYTITMEQEDNVSLDNLEEILEEREKNKILYSIVEKLSKEDKNIFLLFYYYGKKSKEIAKITGISDFTIRNRLHRIRKKMSKKLEEKGYGK